MRRLLYRLLQYIERGEDNAPPTSIDGSAWRSKFDRLNEQLGRPLPTEEKWIACKGSAPQYRGYPCGLWTLFHVLTVDAYTRRGTIFLLNSEGLYLLFQTTVRHLAMRSSPLPSATTLSAFSAAANARRTSRRRPAAELNVICCRYQHVNSPSFSRRTQAR